MKCLFKKNNKISKIYGDESVPVRIAQQWFARFHYGNFDVKILFRSGRPNVEKIDEIMEKTVKLVKKYGTMYGCHILLCKKTEWSEFCISLQTQNEIESFLTRMATEDEK